MVNYKSSESDRDNYLLQKSIYYTFYYGTVSFVLVLVALLLLYVTCSKKYRLNWFEKNLLERSNKIDPAISQEDCVSIGTESENGSNKSLGNLLNDDKFLVSINQAKHHNDKNYFSGNEFSTALLGSKTLVSFFGKCDSEKESQPIARSDKQMILCTTILARPRVCSMNTKLDHAKIDTSYYQEVSNSSTTKDMRGSVNVSLSYDQAAGILSVRLIQAKELLPRDFSGTSDPYVKIRLLPDRKNVWQTRIHKKTTNPIFDEDFVFEVPSLSLCLRTLEIIFYDFDAYSRHLSLGEVRLPLSEIDLTEKVTLWKSLEPCSQPFQNAELGDLMVTLSFLQSAERLTVVVNKARNIRLVDDIRMSSDPFVKISLIQSGRRIRKKKTTVLKNTINPVFNESVTFDISKENLLKTSVEFIVYHDNKIGSDEFLGRTLVGLESECQAEDVKFFKEVLMGKTAVSKWLTLTDSQ